MRNDDKPNLLLNIACFALPLACGALFLIPPRFYPSSFGGLSDTFIDALLNPFYELAVIGVASLLLIHSLARRVRAAAFSALGGCSFLTLLGDTAITFFLLTFKSCC